MNLVTGDMWSVWNEADLFLITANSTIVDGKLVMGAGIALQARERFPGIDARLGLEILSWPGHLGVYGLLISFDWSHLDTRARLGLFQTKTNWRDPSPLSLVRRSVEELAIQAARWDEKRFHLNFPGIGCGGLDPAQVTPLIKTLPDNVNVWRKGE